MDGKNTTHTKISANMSPPRLLRMLFLTFSVVNLFGRLSLDVPNSEFYVRALCKVVSSKFTSDLKYCKDRYGDYN